MSAMNDRRGKAKKPILTRSFTVLDILIYVFLTCLAFMCFVPFYTMFVNTTHDSSTILSGMNFVFGSFAKLKENWIDLMAEKPFWESEIVNTFKNSLIVASLATVLSGYVSTLTAYGFSKYKFKGKGILFVVLLCSMMLPYHLYLIGIIKVLGDIGGVIGMKGGIWALIVPSICSASSVFLLKLYCDSVVPNSIIESSRIDGAGEFRTFNNIVLPMLMPCVATVSIFTFVFQWNNLIVPMQVLNQASKTLPVYINEVKGVYMDKVGAQYVAVAISILPILITFSLFSKYIISGVTDGAIKG
jgi:multiple sugar transport system permease protein